MIKTTEFTCHGKVSVYYRLQTSVNSLEFRGNYSATSNIIKLAHWPLMGGLLHLVQRSQAPPRCTKCNTNSPPVNGQCTNHGIGV